MLMGWALTAGCGDTSAAGGAGGAFVHNDFGGLPEPPFPPSTCYLDPQCVDPADEVACACNGCNPAGCYEPTASPPIESDCTCPICRDSESCNGCVPDGLCDPFIERCDCIDCAGFPSCQ
jgi:hypothetical protein